LQELKITHRKLVVVFNIGGHRIQVLNERSVSDGGNLCPLWLVICKSIWYRVWDSMREAMSCTEKYFAHYCDLKDWNLCIRKQACVFILYLILRNCVMMFHCWHQSVSTITVSWDGKWKFFKINSNILLIVFVKFKAEKWFCQYDEVNNFKTIFCWV